jgi:hypothetical protein
MMQWGSFEMTMKKRRVPGEPVEAMPEMPADPERRADYRFRTIYRVAKVATGCDLGLWRVRNISDGGMMLATSVQVVPGERLSIVLSDTSAIEGKVSWCEGGQCGIAFDQPIDSAALLASLAVEQRAPDYRAPRLPVNSPALVYSETGIQSVRISDLSQQGVGLTHNGSFHAGMKVKILLENGLERRAIVSWSDEEHAGLALVEPFSCEDLESTTRFYD